MRNTKRQENKIFLAGFALIVNLIKRKGLDACDIYIYIYINTLFPSGKVGPNCRNRILISSLTLPIQLP